MICIFVILHFELITIILHLLDVKVTRFGDFVEARTVQCSSFRCLVDSHKFQFSEGKFLVFPIFDAT